MGDVVKFPGNNLGQQVSVTRMWCADCGAERPPGTPSCECGGGLWVSPREMVGQISLVRVD